MMPNSVRIALRLLGIVGLFALAIIYAFPIFYMLLSSFRPEKDIAPPSLSFNFTSDNYTAVLGPDFVHHLNNSLIITGATIVLTVILGVPVAYVIVFGKFNNPQGVYNWLITTTLLPAVAVIMPLYLILNAINQLDSVPMMIALYTSIGVPLMVWMATTYLRDIPQSILEASEIDGCTRWQSFWHVIVPTIRGGVISTSLLVFIITWNEFLFAISFTFTKAATLPVFMNRFMTQQGLFWGKMSAAATLAILLPIVFGFFAQKSLIKGLLTGAVKE